VRIVRTAVPHRGTGPKRRPHRATSGFDPPHQWADHAHRVGRQSGVSGVVHVGRHHGGVGADFSRLHPQPQDYERMREVMATNAM